MSSKNNSFIRKLVPLPKEIEYRDGCFKLSNKVFLVSPEVTADKAISAKLEKFGFMTEDCKDIPALTMVSKDRAISQALKASRKESYCLDIDSAGIALTGADLEGFFWGLVTLEQLMRDEEELPCCVITDWPEIEIRGHFDDISRKRISTVEDFKRIIRKLSYYKINYYGMYIEDVLHLKSYPDIGNGRGKLMPGEIAEIVREAELNKVTIMPFFQLLGHCENMLATDNYKFLGKEVFQAMSTLDPDKPEVRVYLSNCIREVCEIFPGPYFGMGFDETQGISKETYVRHANWCAEEISKYGKKPVFWADMIYNHWGCDTIKELHPALIPANWNYGVKSEEIPHQAELEQQGRPIWGFAGYNNWCCFLPDFGKAKKCIAYWAAALKGKAERGLFCTQWGDDGYENSRDLCWNLFAYQGECCWNGGAEDRFDFEDRFQQTFYGADLPGIKDIVLNFRDKLSFNPQWYWRMHRKNVQSLFRHAKAHPEWKDLMQKDSEAIGEAIEKVNEDIDSAIHEKEHLDNYIVYLKLLQLIVNRKLFAYQYMDSVGTDACIQAAERMINQIFDTRDLYADLWLRNNKRENMEVSVSVFNKVAASYYSLIAGKVVPLRKEFVPVDLSEYYNTNYLDIGGVPLNDTIIHGIPFKFSGMEHTHISLNKEGEELKICFDPINLKDIYLAATSPRPADGKPVEALTVEFYRNGECVHSSPLKLITHLCDWWAPLGEHIWAGGGFRHVDKSRVFYLDNPDHFHGIMCIHHFADKAIGLVDSITLKLKIPHDVQIFALTLEKEH